MKISIKKLKSIIKEEAVVPGAWAANSGEPLDDDDKNKLGTPGGMGSVLSLDETDNENEAPLHHKLQKLLDDEDINEFVTLLYQNVKTNNKFTKYEFEQALQMYAAAGVGKIKMANATF
jgi:hypothetical protein